MIVRKYRTADDRKIRVRSDRIMRKRLYKIEQFCKCIFIDLHRRMLFVEHDAVLVVVNIRAVLKEILLPAQHDRDDAVVLPCRMRKRSGIAFILCAQQTERIA